MRKVPKTSWFSLPSFLTHKDKCSKLLAMESHLLARIDIEIRIKCSTSQRGPSLWIWLQSRHAGKTIPNTSRVETTTQISPWLQRAQSDHLTWRGIQGLASAQLITKRRHLLQWNSNSNRTNLNLDSRSHRMRRRNKVLVLSTNRAESSAPSRTSLAVVESTPTWVRAN